MRTSRLVAFVGTLCVAVTAVAGAEVDFATEVAPLLAGRCGSCHGPDAAESGFRIDLRDLALAGGDSAAAGIVAGSADSSELVRRIETDDPERRMPADGPPLGEAERSLVRRWIDAGAPWPDELAELPADLFTTPAAKPDVAATHWAYQPVRRPEVPVVAAAPHPVDAFLHGPLSAAGLEPQPAADPRTLIRRVSFDLIGLPPTPDEVEAFVAACAEAGGIEAPYADLVDRLLDSPHFGERQARHWLDVVRFAESDGFETNTARANAWPYRDWVIDALDADMPYDDFVRAQLVGDAVGADAATGFLVGGATDRVKSPDPVLSANQRADELHDMVSTTGSAFLGLTVGCARCHDHKFDPVPQTDYYRMKAVFAGVRHGERPIRPAHDADRQAEVAALHEELRPKVRRLAELQPLARVRRSIVVDDLDPERVRFLVAPNAVAAHAAGTERGQADQKGTVTTLPNLGRSYHWWASITRTPVCGYVPQAEGSFRIWISWGCGWDSHSRDTRYLLDDDGDPATTDDQRLIATIDQRLFADGSGEPLRQVSLWSGFHDAGVHAIGPQTQLLMAGGDSGGHVTADTVLFEETTPGETGPARIPHLRPRVAATENVDRFPPVTARFLRFTVRATSDAEPCIDELEVFTVGGRNVASAATPTASGTYANNPFHRLEHINDGQYGNARSWISNEIGGGWVQLEFPEVEEIDRVVWSRDRSEKPQFSDRVARGYDVSVSLDGVSWRPVAGDADRLPFRYVHATGPITAAAELSPNEVAEAETLATQVMAIRSRLAAIETLPVAYAGQFTTPETTHRFFRGDPMQPREEVAPASLTRIGAAIELPATATEQSRRLALADWIVSPDNPLTPRVIVNRLWHHHFGTGIVDTPSDFGVNGGRPSHPELLDFLAAELVRGGWRLKPIHRLIVTSAAYRRSGAASEVGLARDAQTRLLWRYPPRRLEAEPLRDAILAVSGSLDATRGGPGFDLFEPNSNYVKVYVSKTAFAPGDFRRMVYQTKPRSELDTFFGVFDCPDAAQVQPKRTVSTTPMQALNLLNGEFLVDQAARFAARLEREAGSDVAARIRLAFELAFGRPPEPDELQAAADLVAAHGLPSLCRALYNANEFIMVY